MVLNSDVDPNVELTGLKTFYVQKLPADNRGIEKKIADKLNSLGYSASSGISNKPEQPVDAIVTYTDRWMWDITMYMLELNVYFRSPEN